MANEKKKIEPKIDDEFQNMKNFEDILEVVGTTGWWNSLIIFITSFSGFLSALQVMGSGFLGKTPDYWCQVDELATANWTPAQIKQITSPKDQSCVYQNYNFTLLATLGYEAVRDNLHLAPKLNGTTACTRRYFEDNVSTIVTEWDLVCDNLVAYSTTYASVQGGKLIGSLAFGYIIARIGRRKSFLIGAFGFGPSALLTAACFNVYLFSFFRLITQIFISALYFSGFILTMETSTLKQRSLVSSYFVLPWAVGYMSVAGVAYFIRDWRYLQIAVSLPCIVVLLGFWFVPESPRWLCMKGQHEEALDVLKKMAERNKTKLPSDEIVLNALRRFQNNKPLQPADTEQKSCTDIKNFLRNWVSPQLQWRVAAVFFIWLSAAMVYYGVSQGASNFGLNEYLFVFLGGALEIAGYLLLWPGVSYLGCRTCLVIAFGVTASCLLGIMGLQHAGYDGNNIWLALMSYLGKFMISTAFHGAYIITGELFSTDLRSLILGESSVCARIGSMSSPYVNNLMGQTHGWIPAGFFGGFSLVAALVAGFLPQTRGVVLDVHGKDNKALDIEENQLKTETKI